MSDVVLQEKSAEKNGIQSLEVGIDVLNVLLKYPEPLMLKEIGEHLNMHPAKVHRYLVSLIRKNYAMQHSDGRYGLGAHLKQLGAYGNRPLENMQALVQAIQQQFLVSIQVSRWVEDCPVVVQSVESNEPIQVITQIGSRMPLLTSATGRLFASFQPEAVIKPLLERQWQQLPNLSSAASVPKDWQAFLALKKQVTGQGYATVVGDLLMGVNAVSIPLFMHQDQIQYAVTLIGIQSALPNDALGRIGERVLAIRDGIM